MVHGLPSPHPTPHTRTSSSCSAGRCRKLTTLFPHPARVYQAASQTRAGDTGPPPGYSVELQEAGLGQSIGNGKKRGGLPKSHLYPGPALLPAPRSRPGVIPPCSGGHCVHYRRATALENGGSWQRRAQGPCAPQRGTDCTSKALAWGGSAPVTLAWPVPRPHALPK